MQEYWIYDSHDHPAACRLYRPYHGKSMRLQAVLHCQLTLGFSKDIVPKCTALRIRIDSRNYAIRREQYTVKGDICAASDNLHHMSQALCRLILTVADGQCQRLDDRLSLREVLLEFIGKNDSIEAAMLAQGQDALCVEIL